jgi:hypothetical protein
MSNVRAMSLIQSLCDIQYERYTYHEFLNVLKKRLKVFTGRTEIMWFTEIQIAMLLVELNVMGEKKLT